MQISFVPGPNMESGVLVVGMSEGAVLSGFAAESDRLCGGALKRALGTSRFTGKLGQMIELLAPAGVKSSRIILAGLGKSDGFDGAAAERAAAGVVGKLLTSGETEIHFALEVPKPSRLASADLAAHLALGSRLRSYTFNLYRTRNREEYETKLSRISIVTTEISAAKRALVALDVVAEGVFLARDLVNEPPNVLSPAVFAKRAMALAKHGLTVNVLGEAEMQKLGMGAILGVGQGSERESQLVVMQWKGARAKSEPPVAFVGKGVCFDSGGLSLKTGAGMMGMKGDMGGGAAVIGTMLALAKRKARVNAVGIIGLVENMPDGKAQRPDDVVTSMSGQTIEVLNTDAEGRLVLADALWYTQKKFKPKIIVDLATLTGAIVTSLGHEHAGLFSNDDRLADRLVACGRAEGEPVWRMPLSDAYDKSLKSKIADMKNIGGPAAGSITAAQFLQRFVEKTPWAHLDIAGVAWQDGEHKPLSPGWGTGWGVRILNRLVADHFET